MIFWGSHGVYRRRVIPGFPGLSKKDPKYQAWRKTYSSRHLIVVVGGSLLGEVLGINRLLGKLWFWFGHQGWNTWIWAEAGDPVGGWG